MPPIDNRSIQDGFWGQPTSTIDWCELNYELSYFVAEFWNTLTNLVFIIPPLISSIQLYQHKLPPIYILSLIYLSFTGLGSLFFHMTLKYPMQLWDELAMIWEGLLVTYLFLNILNAERANNVITIVAIISYGLIIKAIYLFINEPIFFQLGFASIHYFALFLGYRITRKYPCSPKLFWFATLITHIAFIFWCADNMFCPMLQSVRAKIPSGLKPFTQFHAVWHVLAGFGTYSIVLFGIHAYFLTQKKVFRLKLHPLSGLALERWKWLIWWDKCNQILYPQAAIFSNNSISSLIWRWRTSYMRRELDKTCLRRH